jgi:hypothetical protein
MIPFEQDNLDAYKLLLRIEVILRESLRESYEEQFGNSWRNRLPGDLLKKIRDAQVEEKQPQFDYLCLGPLYYLSMGELLSLLQQKSGSGVARRFGGECFIKQIENILGPRNAICHARCVSSIGLKLIEVLYLQMEATLTPNGLKELLLKPDTGIYQESVARGLIPWLNEAEAIICQLDNPVPITPIYDTAKSQYWWGNTALAGFDCVIIDQVTILLIEYNALPAGIGSAAGRQRFCEDRNLVTVLESAIKQLEGLIK